MTAEVETYQGTATPRRKLRGIAKRCPGTLANDHIDLRDEGAAGLKVSQGLDEIFEFCDRIAALPEGCLSRTKTSGETDAQEIGLWMSGHFAAPAESEGAARAD